MELERVVVTGIGIISAIGSNHQDYWASLTSGISGIATISQVDCSDMRFQLGAEVKNYEAENYFDFRQLKFMDRFAQFALISADEAISDSGFTKQDIANPDTAVITGSCVGGQNTLNESYHRLYHEKKKLLPPQVVPNVMANSSASHIALKYGIVGPSYTISSACASSTHAIGQAYWFIRQGLVSRAIAGGSEAPFSLGHLRAWESLRVISADTCRPFSKNRSGMILGEGGAMLVLESLSSALNRGATIYAEMVGFGMSSDANHITDPASSGQQQAIVAALNDAKINASSIQYINAHGTGTIMNDKIESMTIQSVFSDVNSLAVSSTKASHGHLLGATGAAETIATVLAIKHQLIPPTLHFLENDPECDMPLVVNKARSCEIDYALCLSFAFGGMNAVLALRRYE